MKEPGLDGIRINVFELVNSLNSVGQFFHPERRMLLRVENADARTGRVTLRCEKPAEYGISVLVVRLYDKVFKAAVVGHGVTAQKLAAGHEIEVADAGGACVLKR